MRFGATFFVSPTGSRHLGEMKIVPMIKTSDHQGTLQFFWNGERSLKVNKQKTTIGGRFLFCMLLELTVTIKSSRLPVAINYFIFCFHFQFFNDKTFYQMTFTTLRFEWMKIFILVNDIFFLTIYLKKKGIIFL